MLFPFGGVRKPDAACSMTIRLSPLSALPNETVIAAGVTRKPQGQRPVILPKGTRSHAASASDLRFTWPRMRSGRAIGSRFEPKRQPRCSAPRESTPARSPSMAEYKRDARSAPVPKLLRPLDRVVGLMQSVLEAVDAAPAPVAPASISAMATTAVVSFDLQSSLVFRCFIVATIPRAFNVAPFGRSLAEGLFS